MNAQGPNPYLRTKVMTASPAELRLMLFDGALRFARRGREALEAGDFEQSYEGLNRAQKIVLELATGLNREVAPEVCDRLSSLYTYLYRRLVDASMQRDPQIVDEAITLLEYERETWRLVLEKAEEGAEQSDDQGAAIPAEAAGRLSQSA